MLVFGKSALFVYTMFFKFCLYNVFRSPFFEILLEILIIFLDPAVELIQGILDLQKQ